VSVCLADTVRSQSFSLSQRFEPARASWLCFTPHPPIGFRSPELFPPGRPWHLSMLVTLVSFVRQTSWSPRLQSFAPTWSPCSKPVRLGTGTSRCSHDLSPLRGVPSQSLGLRPPLMRLLRHEPQRPKTRCLVASRHFRVSIRLGLGATPKTGSNLRGVCNLIRSPRHSSDTREREASVSPGLSLVVKGHHPPKRGLARHAG
jgi:hypothetical protein